MALEFQSPCPANKNEDESNDNNKSYSNESESKTESNVESDSESKSDKILDADDKIEGGNFEPEPKIIDEAPNPTVVINENLEATINEATEDDEPPPLAPRRSARETR